MPSYRSFLPSKYPGETILGVFDFLPDLSPGDTVIGTPTVFASLYSGPTGANLPTFGPATPASSKVSVPISAGVEGCTYTATCIVGTAAGLSLRKDAYLVILGPQP